MKTNVKLEKPSENYFKKRMQKESINYIFITSTLVWKTLHTKLTNN